MNQEDKKRDAILRRLLEMPPEPMNNAKDRGGSMAPSLEQRVLELETFRRGVTIAAFVIAGVITLFGTVGTFQRYAQMESLDTQISGIRTDLSGLRTEFTSAISDLRSDMREGDTLLRAEISGLRSDMATRDDKLLEHYINIQRQLDALPERINQQTQ